jgi:hypothetical protein
VLLGSGDRFNVQLMNKARRPVKSYVVSSMPRLSRRDRQRYKGRLLTKA